MNNKTIVVIDNQLFPCFNYIRELSTCKHIKLEKYEGFQKMSFRNRYLIAGANSIMNLTIPVKGGREQKTLITEVRIDNSINWQIKHWRSLTSAYRKAPFFEFYYQEIKKLLFSEEELLFTFNFNILNWLCKTLKINAEIEFTESFIVHYEEEADYRNYFTPKSFQENTINRFPHYSQVFEDRLGFQPNLTIIDAIFCEGPNAVDLLKRDK